MYKRNKGTESVEKLVKNRGKKFVRLEESAEYYSVGKNTFRKWAQDAGAVYRINRITLYNLEKMDEFLESFEEEN